MPSTILIEAGLHDDEWNRQARSETPMQRLDRNWADLLQELRVLQTGVQLVTGCLLLLPFQSRFAQLTPFQTAVYLLTVCLSVTATGLLVAPVSLHRVLFRRHGRALLVSTSHRLVIAGLSSLGCAVVGVLLMIFTVVAGWLVGLVVAGTATLLLGWLWIAMPRRHRRTLGDPARHQESVRNT
jgi:O-antigen/teichoic acid export membrane protein